MPLGSQEQPTWCSSLRAAPRGCGHGEPPGEAKEGGGDRCASGAQRRCCFLPTQSIVSKNAMQYRGSSQHDAQEFLLWLLDRVHEDLNNLVKNNGSPPLKVVLAAAQSEFSRPQLLPERREGQTWGWAGAGPSLSCVLPQLRVLEGLPPLGCPPSPS